MSREGRASGRRVSLLEKVGGIMHKAARLWEIECRRDDRLAEDRREVIDPMAGRRALLVDMKGCVRGAALADSETEKARENKNIWARVMRKWRR
jgi:hypothetical protein